MFMETDRDIIPGGNAGPIIFVDTVDEVMPALGLSCKCGDKEEKHAVARVLNKDYFILYHEIAESMASTRTEVDPNAANLFGRKVVPESVLAEVMTNNDELKKRRGAMMCATENFNGFISDKFKELGNQ
ncbi:hypothetical protein B5X24_HaOG204557 [Helicoverpa armigera]|nr:hypothetical protein B5X24_HaOG204557 [Helicoverpa armigera]